MLHRRDECEIRVEPIGKLVVLLRKDGELECGNEEESQKARPSWDPFREFEVV